MSLIEDFANRISYESLQNIYNAVCRGYQLAEVCINETPWMRVPSARNFKQNYYNFAVDFILQQSVREGILEGFDISFEPTKRKNYNYSRLQKNNSILTLSSATGYASMPLPRPAIFRENLSYGQIGFEDLDENQTARAASANDVKYGIVCHRYSLKGKEVWPFTFLGIPDRLYTGWVESRELQEVLVNGNRDKNSFKVFKSEDEQLITSFKDGVEQIFNSESEQNA